MISSISVVICKKRLTIVWFVGAGIIFAIVLLQSVFGRYAEHTTDAWSWFLPTVMPALSLIIGVLVADAMRGTICDRRIDPFMFRLTFSLSIAYFVIVLATILLQPFAPGPPLALLAMSNLWLGPFQGLVIGALGAFFVRAEQAG